MTSTLEKNMFTILDLGFYQGKCYDLLPSLFGEEINRIECMCLRAGVIPVMEYGDNTNEVKIVYADGHTAIQTIAQFEQDAKERDVFLIDRDINPEIDHVEIQISNKRFPVGIRLIAPPLLDFGSKRLVVTKFLAQSDAILFELNATHLFSENERRFIADYLEYRSFRTFFVVSRINNVYDFKLIETAVKPTVRENLRKVFVDENGVFNDDLYNKRVFYVDAYCAHCVRSGIPATVMVGKKEIAVEFDIHDSGVPEFEDEFYRFMNTMNVSSCIMKCCKEASESLETKLHQVYKTWLDGVAYQWGAFFEENWIKLSLRDRLFLIGGNGESLIKERLRRLDHAFSDYLRKEEPGLAQVLEEAIQHHMTVLEMQLMEVFAPVYSSAPELYAKFVSTLENKYDLKHAPPKSIVLPKLITSIIKRKWISKMIRGPFLSYVLISDISLDKRTNLALQFVRTGKNFENYISQMEKEFCITALRDKMPEILIKYPKFIRECGEEIAEVLGEV